MENTNTEAGNPASAPAASAAPSIDTLEFRHLCAQYVNRPALDGEPRKELVAHINQHVAAARKEAYEAGRLYEQEIATQEAEEAADRAEAGAVKRAEACDVPPAGWACTRTAGHSGPCAAIRAAAAPMSEGPIAGDEKLAKWHAPGMGEVHYHDHSLMIDCRREIDDPEQDYVADDELAKLVCAALNAAPVSAHPLADQKPLDPNVARIIRENMDSLYVEDAAPMSEAGQAQGETLIGAPDFRHIFAEHCERDGYPSDDAGTQAMLWKFFTYGMAATQPAAMDEAAERARFETWGEDLFSYGFEPKTWHVVEYKHEGTQMAWEGWKARAALAAPQGNSEQAAELPALPPHDFDAGTIARWHAWDADSMATYARSALALRQTQDEDAIREHLARVFEAMPADGKLRGSQIAGQIRAAKQAKKEGA